MLKYFTSIFCLFSLFLIRICFTFRFEIEMFSISSGGAAAETTVPVDLQRQAVRGLTITLETVFVVVAICLESERIKIILFVGNRQK